MLRRCLILTLQLTHVNNGRYSVSEDGTLSISSAHLYDSGRYVCTAVNELGTARAGVRIFVTGGSYFSRSDRPLFI